MAKPELGSKRQCADCGTKFFDLNKTPIVCPKCGAVFQVASATPTRGSRAAPADDDEAEVETESGADTVPLEDADSTDDGKVAPATAEDEADTDDEAPADDDDDDTFLEEEEEDDGDVSGLIDGDIEDDEER